MPIKGIDADNNPLNFVDRLLEDERDSNLHFGDVRFWKHIEFIDRQQIYRTTSLEYKVLKMMFCEAVFYIVFLMALTGFIIQIRPSNVYEARRQQLDYWGGCRRGYTGTRGEGGCAYQDIQNRDDLMDWMVNDMAPKAFTDKDIYEGLVNYTSVYRLQKGIAPWSPRYVGDTKSNLLIGTIRVRQLRVQYNKGCTVKAEYAEVQEDCFAPFSGDVQSRFSWAPTWTPGHLVDYFQWTSANKTLMPLVTGEHGTYPGDGFYFDFPMNLTGSQVRLQELKAWDWLDVRTRGVVIELSVLNPNTNIFVHNNFLFEFPATGGIVKRHEAYAFQTLQLSLSLMATDDVMTFAYLVITCSFHFLLFSYTVFMLYKNGASYFSYFWSSVDFAILIFFFSSVSTNLAVYYKAYLLPELAPDVLGDPEMFFTIGHLIRDIELANSFMGVLGVLAWLKVLKYFTLSATFHPFVRIIERCLYNLVLFGALLIVVLFGFACAFYIGYGGEDDVFSTLFGSFIAIIVAPAGGVSLAPIFDKNDAVGPVLVIVYFILIYLLLLNTFLAICVDVYSVCMYELREVHKMASQAPAALFLWTYFNALRSTKLVGKETEEDKGTWDEQTIALSSLPEAVSLRYLDTKHKMKSILNEAEAEIEKVKLELLRQQGIEGLEKNGPQRNMLALGNGGDAKLSRQGAISSLDLQWEVPSDAIFIVTEYDRCDGELDVYHGNPRRYSATIPPDESLVICPLELDNKGYFYWQDETLKSSEEDKWERKEEERMKKHQDPSTNPSPPWEFDRTCPGGKDGSMVNCAQVTRGPGRQIQWDFYFVPSMPSGEGEMDEASQLKEEMGRTVVKRVQLQRMIDDDPILQDICGGTGIRAVDIIRRFRVDRSGVDPYEAVARLQADVTKKLKELEKGKHGLHFEEVETLRTVSEELHSAMTESQKEWRAELLSVLQMATLLSKALVTLTHQMESVQNNHKDLSQKCGPPK